MPGQTDAAVYFKEVESLYPVIRGIFMRSDTVKKGVERTPHKALLKAVGVTDEDLGRPFIGIANAWNDIVPGHKHLRELAERIRQGIREAGGVPFEFGIIGICDGIAMGHEGMAFSLPSR
jgi:dihydroxy-acid dehydratase